MNESHHSLLYLMSTINNVEKHSADDPSDVSARYLADKLLVHKLDSQVWSNGTVTGKSQFLEDCESAIFEKDQKGKLGPLGHQTTVAFISHLLSTINGSSNTCRQ